MFFNFVRPKLVVDAFTMFAEINEINPIIPAVQAIPEWWKSLPKRCPMPGTTVAGLEMPTMRTCPAVTELFTTGFVMPLWSDLALETKASGNSTWYWAGKVSDDADAGVSWHDKNQYGPILDGHIHLKLSSPWYISEKKGVSFYFTNPFWSQIELLQYIHTCPAIVSYKYQAQTNINILLPKIDRTMVVPSGTPMVHWIPLTDKAVIIKTHVISPREAHDRFSDFRTSFFSNYAKTTKCKEKST